MFIFPDRLGPILVWQSTCPGYKIIPDADTNWFMAALGRLQDSLKKLKLTRKVTDDPDFEVWKPHEYWLCYMAHRLSIEGPLYYSL
ncbi:hypothetical protein SQ11_12590 [Nitrosospira sp. NpAV]|nr:hypothetical protein SQ11_12590 [Nitrosospira sp. NpAV]